MPFVRVPFLLPQGILLADGRRLAGEDDKRGLESILGILVMAQGAAANIPDEPLMPAQEHRKRLVVVLAEVEMQKPAVTEVPGLLGIDQVANVLQDCMGCVGGHSGISDACPALSSL
jgi:hypothetical protein